MTKEKVYVVEKRFKEVFGLIPRTDVYISETPAKTYILWVPHPNGEVDYVLSTWENPKSPREFADLGRCAHSALKAGAVSINFDVKA